MRSQGVVGVTIARIDPKPREELLCDGVHERGILAWFFTSFLGQNRTRSRGYR